MNVVRTALGLLHGLVATCLMWLYFTCGFALGFAPAYLVVRLFSRRSTWRFQQLNRAFYAGFFGLLGLLVPRFGVRCDPEIGRLRSSVVVCNHVSYFDPLLLIRLLERPVTIVKGRFFQAPVLSWIMRRSGYIPAEGAGRHEALVYSRIAGLPGYLAEGGNLFVFPEGTRNPGTRLGAFLPGAFKLARRCDAPLELLFLRHPECIFPPRGFLLRPWAARTVTVERLGRLHPDYADPAFRLEALIAQVRDLYLARLARELDGACDDERPSAG